MAHKNPEFDPNALGISGNNLFGLPYTVDTARIIVVPVPWEVTVSYGAGTADGPQAIFDASFQVDLYDPLVKDAWKIGIAMEDVPQEVRKRSDSLRARSERYIEFLADGGEVSQVREMLAVQREINGACSELKEWVKERTARYLDSGKLVALLGGDHSTPLGYIEALSGRHESFGILQIDAHSDLRDAYEGFTYSHASVMFNAIKIPQLEKLVQVGIRDYCEAEVDVINKSNGRVTTFFDRDLKRSRFEGESWHSTCLRIVKELPKKVYLSFDIDGLDAKLCPNTGTPVPGGFELEEVLYLIQCVVEEGRTIIGFDINEVSPGEDDWDASVAARALYRIANLAAKSRGLT